jgi:hypothetical protein
MWLIPLAIVNLALLAAAAGTLLLSLGCAWLAERRGGGWLNGCAAALRVAARVFTLALVVAVLASTALLVLAWLGPLS